MAARKHEGAVGMNRYVHGEDRHQLSFAPLSFDDMITEDNPVRAI